jgi:hypothetical protein
MVISHHIFEIELKPQAGTRLQNTDTEMPAIMGPTRQLYR